MKKIIGITMGDAAGIGPEIILKYFKYYYNSNKPFLPVIIGNYNWLNFINKKLGYNLCLKKIKSIDNILHKESIPIYDSVEMDLSKIKIGEINKIAGNAAGKFIEDGIELCQKKSIAGLVTAPINKEALNLGGYNFPGHTQMLAALTETKNYAMMLMGKWLKVVLITDHISIKNVSKNITIKNILDKVNVTEEAMKIDFDIANPRIAVLGLNPHSGENGLIGNEENRIIKPAIELLKNKKINIEGPFSADTFFSVSKNKFDAVICMYHDQGLIPLKLISFGCGVNVTLGLPIIRTSVDHGTGYDIVLKGKADCNSLKESINTAYKIIKNRYKNNQKINCTNLQAI